ncbi:hypothetical protein CAOG_00338 [Capsaspora owczarzaki ATCC 30864]|uniref:RRM domain-containing protein n=1 Tax=Capsaspora owczarzaki (strain ATCC 30864) TaxID=595528 RepID=A0A0D2WGX4_CAPO3|nr:hypothetical protein CAOG_00338 [Capsaspora owczarzaki ATCC 30864]KJE88745.1 hypothetical protein CAOG_000338 [Capsaspora owczarzaki ATCC 30864]|eukprot:XP_004365209.2 hypothetical protein CAOG_00338 [Capsaspora owczarzaki ATCC 30864]
MQRPSLGAAAAGQSGSRVPPLTKTPVRAATATAVPPPLQPAFTFKTTATTTIAAAVPLPPMLTAAHPRTTSTKPPPLRPVSATMATTAVLQPPMLTAVHPRTTTPMTSSTRPPPAASVAPSRPSSRCARRTKAVRSAATNSTTVTPPPVSTLSTLSTLSISNFPEQWQPAQVLQWLHVLLDSIAPISHAPATVPPLTAASVAASSIGSEHRPTTSAAMLGSGLSLTVIRAQPTVMVSAAFRSRAQLTAARHLLQQAPLPAPLTIVEPGMSVPSRPSVPSLQPNSVPPKTAPRLSAKPNPPIGSAQGKGAQPAPPLTRKADLAGPASRPAAVPFAFSMPPPATFPPPTPEILASIASTLHAHPDIYMQVVNWMMLRGLPFPSSTPAASASTTTQPSNPLPTIPTNGSVGAGSARRKTHVDDPQLSEGESELGSDDEDDPSKPSTSSAAAQMDTSTASSIAPAPRVLSKRARKRMRTITGKHRAKTAKLVGQPMWQPSAAAAAGLPTVFPVDISHANHPTRATAAKRAAQATISVASCTRSATLTKNQKRRARRKEATRKRWAVDNASDEPPSSSQPVLLEAEHAMLRSQQMNDVSAAQSSGTADHVFDLPANAAAAPPVQRSKRRRSGRKNKSVKAVETSRAASAPAAAAIPPLNKKNTSPAEVRASTASSTPKQPKRSKRQKPPSKQPEQPQQQSAASTKPPVNTPAKTTDYASITPLSDADLQAKRLSPDVLAQSKAFAKAEYQPGSQSSRLFIRNLSDRTRLRDLYAVYNRYRAGLTGAPEASLAAASQNVRIQLITGGPFKHQAFVTLANEACASVALEETHGVVIKGKPLVVHFATSDRPRKAKAAKVGAPSVMMSEGADSLPGSEPTGSFDATLSAMVE